MWLYTRLGFFSVVHKPPCRKDELLVRARCKADIEKLAVKLSQKHNFKARIIASLDADYAYRMKVPRSILGAFLANLTDELDYGNFKATIPHNDYARHDAYMACWELMFKWQIDLIKN